MAHDHASTSRRSVERDFWTAFRRRDCAQFRDVVDRVENSRVISTSDARSFSFTGGEMILAGLRHFAGFDDKVDFWFSTANVVPAKTVAPAPTRMLIRHASVS